MHGMRPRWVSIACPAAAAKGGKFQSQILPSKWMHGWRDPAARACVGACNYGGTLRPRQPCGSVHWQRHTVDLVCNCSTAAAYWNCVVAFFCSATMAASMTRCAVPALTPFAGLRWQHPACLRSQQLKSLCECKTGQPDARLAPMHDASGMEYT